MNYDELTSGLLTETFGRRLYLFEVTDSTNNVALRMGYYGAPEGTVVLAEHQTAGRGRRHRQWLAPPGSSILASVIVRPTSPLHVPVPAPTSAQTGSLATPSETWYTLLTALSIAEGVTRMTGLKALVKWPNDVWIYHRKVCGILAEHARDQNGQPYYAVGFGINVNFTRDEIPPSIRQTATAISLLLGFEISREALLQRVLKELEDRVREFRTNGTRWVSRELQHRSLVFRRWVRAETEEGIIEGNVCGFDEDGSLLIQQDDQRIVQLRAGDVHLVKDSLPA